MGLKSRLKKMEEIAELMIVYPYVSPYDLDVLGHSRGVRLVNKYRNSLTGNPYFTKFIEPLVIRLHDDAVQSKRVVKFPCKYLVDGKPQGSTLGYSIGKYTVPILTMGSEKQLQEVCKKECCICPILVYNPLAVAGGLMELSIFEAAGAVSKVRNKIRI